LADIIDESRADRAIPGRHRSRRFRQQWLAADAVERCLERVCEAAHRLGEHAAEMMPNQPWSDIRSMGNRLRHAYDRISLDVIWNAARSDLPGLAVDARRALAQLQADQNNARGTM
jgi:uncharacterized protein with HEPN domain